MGLIVSLFVLLFFAYGHFYYLLGDFKREIAGHTFDAYKLYFISSGIILPLGIFFSIRTRKNLENLTKILNVIALSLVLIPAVNSGYFKLKSGAVWQKGIESEEVSKGAEVTSYPTIYYIILDAYARGDILREMYRYDNSDFLNYLREKGFYVAEKSTSNYCRTILSLLSSFNLQYLDDIVDRVGIKSKDREMMNRALNDNYVFKFVKQYGYKTISFDTFIEFVGTEKTDVFYKQSRLSLFQVILIESTPIRIILERLKIKKGLDRHREGILFVFDKIELSKNEDRKFVFAHIVSPHMPFVFGKNGERTNLDHSIFDKIVPRHRWMGDLAPLYRDYYRKQVIFLNKKVRHMIDAILANSSEPPIIILQADHGPASMLDQESMERTNLKERMTILNAYYLPGGGDKKLYPSISPVNTFRIIFNHYFKTNYPLLEDKSYFSTKSQTYNFIDITDKVTEKKK